VGSEAGHFLDLRQFHQSRGRGTFDNDGNIWSGAQTLSNYVLPTPWSFDYMSYINTTAKR